MKPGPSDEFIYIITGFSLLVCAAAVIFGFYGGEYHSGCIAFCR
jgi:hypothetical protein